MTGATQRGTSFLVLETQFGNIGDALINRELLQLLRAHGAVCVDTGAAPDWFVRMLALPDDARRVQGRGRLLLAMLGERLRGQPAYFFFLPGGIVGELSPRQFVRKTLLLALFFVLRLAGVRFCHLGVSYERLGPRHGAYLRLKQALMHAFYVRDRRSAALLQSHRVRTSGVLPDLAFNLARRAAPRAGGLGAVGLSFRTDQHPGQYEHVLAAVETLRAALPAGVACHLVVQVEHDQPGMARLAQHLAQAGVAVRLVEETRDLERLQAHYAGLDLVISNRLHVLLLAASVGCQVLACVDERNEKIVGLLESLGREDLLLPLAGLDAAAVARALAAPRLDAGAQRDALRAGVARIFDTGEPVPAGARS